MGPSLPLTRPRGMMPGMLFPPRSVADGVVTLRPLDLVDVRTHLAGEDAELIRWLNGGRGTPERVDAHVRRSMTLWEAGGPTFSFGIRVGADDLLVGTIDVQLGHEALVPGQANLAYGLYANARGCGFATRAVVLGCRFAAALPGVAEAVTRVDPQNPRSAAVAVRAGFRYAGHRIEVTEGGMDWYVRALTPEDGPICHPH